MRISLKTIFFALFIFLMFLPEYFANPVFQLAQNGMFLIITFMLIYKRYRLNRVTLAIVIHYVFLILLTAIYKYWPFDIHVLISHAKIIVCILAIDYMMDSKPVACVNVLFYISLFYVLADFISIILYPEGLYFVVKHWNEWSSFQSALWILGNKNNRIMWQLILQIVTFAKFSLTGRHKSIMPYVITGISIIASILVKSSTATVVNTLAFLGLIVANWQTRIAGRFRLKAKWVFLAFLIINIAIISGNLLTQESSFLAILVERVLGKDLSTISARRIAWTKVLTQISQHPFGHGLINSIYAPILLGSAAFTDAHNMLLDLSWEGGVISLAALLCILFSMAKNADSLTNPRNKVMVFAFMACFLLEGLTEAILGQPYGWYYLIILYCVIRHLEKAPTTTQPHPIQLR